MGEDRGKVSGGLTARQAELLDCICQRIDHIGVAPTHGEMCRAMGLHSKSGTHRMLRELEARGFVRVHPSRSRGIEVLRRPVKGVWVHLESEAKQRLEGMARTMGVSLEDYCAQVLENSVKLASIRRPMAIGLAPVT